MNNNYEPVECGKYGDCEKTDLVSGDCSNLTNESPWCFRPKDAPRIGENYEKMFRIMNRK